eukprot:CAMPEP_0201667824 /NCGR_PEP_ID=MMETSP0494-20130426/16871_1 /ASSEMBLY_ACC=CAM_ASM_000839 /TAXON_ID=420259 /ORGANISM="Thalassiosira gravida, Strain GMp14c1" /LENGTH=1166 /DNA_ID=CAMNT_0048147977 /DNA_START=72 /DNA_END=3572 /DNA_ORIENTATION=-
MDETSVIGTLEQQVIEAALITTRPTSSAQERSEASTQLERWTTGTSPSAASPIDTACWEAYIKIIGISFCPSDHFFSSSNASSSPNQSGQSSGFSNGSAESNIVEKIAYATFSSKQQQPLSCNTEQQIQRDSNGAKLLLTTLFCNKIRREYNSLMREHASLARRVFESLLNALLCVGNVAHVHQGQDLKALLGACCSAVASVAVRTSIQQSPNQGIMNIILPCRNFIGASLGMAVNATTDMPSFSPTIALRLLADIPGEAQSRNDVTTTDIEALLQMPNGIPSQQGIDFTINGSATDVVMETLHMALSGYISGGGEQQDALLCLTLNALTKWAEACKKITLSRLLESSNGNALSILEQLVALLSSQSQQRQWTSAKHAEDAIIKSARALNACIENTTDFGTQSRRSAVGSLLASLTAPTKFLIAPFNTSESQQWEEAAIAVSNLASTLAREEIDEIATCRLPGCSDLIELLLGLQSHPIHNVALPVLEVWLALQDVPTSDRHPTLAAPLYQQLTEVVLNRVAYPSTFISWEEELDLESSDFNEMRRLSTDVLVGAYYLLRSSYLETLANIVMSIDSSDWEVVESAFFCMCSVGREACARVKSVKNAASSGRDSPVAADGESTSIGLTQVVGIVCAGGAAGVSQRHPLVLAGIANFLGCYSTVWASSCAPQSMLEILAYLSAALSVSGAAEASGKSIRLVLIASAGKLTKAATSPGADISVALTQSMEAALNTNKQTVMASVAEGCARVSVQLRDKSKARATLSAVAAPTILRARSALDAMISSSTVEGSGQAAGQTDAASQALASYLGVLRELVRFCDGSSSRGRAGDSHILSDVLTAAWPVLNDISSHPTCRANEAVLSGLLDVHSQLLSVVPALIGPYFKDLATFVVKSYEVSFCPSALDYVSAAVESFDSEESIGVAAGLDENGKDLIFNQLLAHLSQCTFKYVTQTKRPNECPQLIKALFEMAQRYLLFCPGALCQCPEFSSLFGLAVACLVECKGEVESTRATLIFITQLVGWKHIRLPDAKMAKLAQFACGIDNLLAQHGEAITKACLGGLSGGAPQMLWPSCSECIFSITQHIISSTPGADEPDSVLCTWLRTAMIEGSLVANTKNITPEIGTSVIKILCELAKEGTKSKQKAKMALMDFGKIAKGEASTDVLLAYSMA